MSCKEYVTSEDIERIFQNFTKEAVEIQNMEDVLNSLKQTFGSKFDAFPEYHNRLRELDKQKKKKKKLLAQAKSLELNSLFDWIDLSRANLAIMLAGFVAALAIEIEQMSELQIIGSVKTIINGIETLVKSLKGIDVAQMATSTAGIMSALITDTGGLSIISAAKQNAQHALGGVLSESNNLMKSVSGTMDSIMSIAETTTGIMTALKAISLIMQELQGAISTVVQFVQNVLASIEQAVASIAMGVLQLTEMGTNIIANLLGKFIETLKIPTDPVSENYLTAEQIKASIQ